jgi:hypothetical protein
LASDRNEAKQILEHCLKDKSLEEVYSAVIIPALSLAEQDRHRDRLDEETQNFIYQSTREIVEELGDSPSQPSLQADVRNCSETPIADLETRGLDVLCIPARDEADDVIAALLAQILRRQGRFAQSIRIGPVATMLSAVLELNPVVVCISALPPFALSHARGLYTRLREQFPELHIVICLWHFDGELRQAEIGFRMAKGHGFFTTLPDVSQHVSFWLNSLVPGS